MKVVVLENNLVFVTRIERKLQDLGIECALASTPSVAISLLSDEVKAVIADLNAPGALEFIAHAKAHSSAKVLAFSCHSQVEMRKEAKKAGVETVMTNSKLLSAMDTILGKLATNQRPQGGVQRTEKELVG